MRTVRGPLTGLVSCLLLALPASAMGATGDVAQLSGTNGCIQSTPLDPSDNCSGALDTSLNGTYSVAVTPDGKNVYGIGYLTGSMDTFSRNSTDGSLTEIQCIQDTATAPCSGGAHEVGGYVVLANNQSVYSIGSDGISEFSRDPSTGLLTYIGCIGAHFQCTSNSVGNAYNGALSADGKNVYVVDPGGTVTILTRDTITGLLSYRGCLNAAGSGGCTASSHIASPYSVAVSPDGKNVYVSNAQGPAYAAIAYTRDPSTGDLTFLGCLAADASAGCGQGYALGYTPRWTVVSPDGKSVYIDDEGFGGIAVLQRSTVDGSITQSSTPAGCVKASGTACTVATGLEGPWGIVVSPDNANVYVADDGGSNLLAFSRSSTTGALTQLTTTPCIGQTPCTAGRAMGGFRGIAIAPDGKNVYGSAFFSKAIDIFSRATSSPQPPANIALPTISGSTVLGAKLTESNATWSNGPITARSYQWLRCDSAGNSCTNISGATSLTYVLASADIGRRIRVRETATNSVGTSAPAVSASTPVVQAPTVSKLRVAKRRFRGAHKGKSVTTLPNVGTKVSFELNVAGTVRFTIERQAVGRRVGNRCVALTRKNRSKRRCQLWTKLKGSFTITGKLGSNSFGFSGRFNGATLKPGSYRLTATPGTGKAQSTTFTIIR